MGVTLPLRLPAVRLVGAMILRDGQMRQRSVSVERGRIVRGPLPAVDLSGYLILPGIVDLHGGEVGRHLRRHHDPAAALAEADRAAAAAGITTAWLPQHWSWEGGPRGPDAAEAMLAALAAARRHARIDLRAQLLAQTHMPGSGARLMAAVARWRVGAVMFDNLLDRLPDRPEALARRAALLGRPAQALAADAQAALASAREVPRHLCTMADGFDRLGVSFGSHRDSCGETRERFSMIGARIALCPRVHAAAGVARAMGEPVLAAAASLNGGRAPDDRVGAADLIAAGLCDALVSDGHPAALAEAAFAMVDTGLADLPAAWAMISSRPAEVMRLVDRGTLDLGRRADLVVVNARSRQVECTIAAGRLVHHAGQAGARLLAAAGGGAARVAAE